MSERSSQLRVGESLHDFTVISRSSIPEYRSEGIYLRHRTGATVYHLVSDDIDNLFCFAFRTLPVNSRGTPHILEHSVLSGSEHFPLKDPFIALSKGSVNTFLNAMTYPDKTVYPASSTVSKDYFNLMEVYGDAVFFPLLKPEIFHQEGRRYEFDADGKLNLVGVVYNEMLGVYGDVDSIVGEWSYRALFPDSPYGFDSGGDPTEIPDLTYEEFRRFHADHYHPANCRIFLYGNIPTEPQLAFLDEHFLSKFDSTEIPPESLDQPKWSSPRSMEVPAPLGEGEDAERTSSITINWLTVSATEPKDLLSMEILSEILLGNSGAPIHKAIIESEIGEDLSPQSGLESEVKQLAFTIGVRGTEPEKRAELEELVLSELRKLVEKGIPEEVVRGALKRVEFRNREIMGGVPFGLRLMGKALRGWLHDTDPEATLSFTNWMEEIKREAQKPGYFEGYIQRELIENPHRATVTVRPDPVFTKEQTRKLREKLDALSSKMGESERNSVLADSAALKQFQDVPDGPEVVSSIPTLKIEDIPRDVEKIETGSLEREGVPIYTHELFTNGVTYIDLAFDLSRLPAENLALLPLYSKATCGLGFPGVPYDEVARQLALRTGGVYSFLEASGIPADGNDMASYLFFRLKVLREDLATGRGIFERMVVDSDFQDTKHIHDLLVEMRNDFKASVLPRGNSYASLRAGSRLSAAFAREELWGGAEQLLYLDRLVRKEHAERDLSRAFESLREGLTSRSGLTVSIATEADTMPEAIAEVEALIGRLPAGDRKADRNLRTQLTSAARRDEVESFTVPSEVGYAATVVPASRMTEEGHAHEVLLAHLLRSEYLWEKIRMRGGAYGAGANANGTDGLFSFSSYRDPKVPATLEVFREALEFASTSKLDVQSLEKTIIGAVGRDLHPMAPGEKNIVGLRRKLYGITDEMRQTKRDALMNARPDQVADSARRLIDSFERRSSALLAGRELITNARNSRKDIAEPISLPL